MMLAPIEMMRATVDGMMARGFGRIINISSRSVKIPQLELGLSNGARTGLVGFVAGLARQTVAPQRHDQQLLPGIFDSDAQKRHIEGMLADLGKTFDQVWKERAAGEPRQALRQSGGIRRLLRLSLLGACGLHFGPEPADRWRQLSRHVLG